jgi:hypothetical protein
MENGSDGARRALSYSMNKDETESSLLIRRIVSAITSATDS